MVTKKVVLKTLTSERLSELFRQLSYLRAGLHSAQTNVGHMEKELWKEAKVLGAERSAGWMIEYDHDTQTATARPREGNK